jgi:aspartyl-tRNA(Asn)/glutamyl-tRNA(Gln) amidotransferase subunit B
MLSTPEIENLVNQALLANKQLVDKLGKNAFGALMGQVMKEARGKANPELVNGLIRKKLGA